MTYAKTWRGRRFGVSRRASITDAGRKALAGCEGRWPSVCTDAWPATRWLWCDSCLTSQNNRAKVDTLTREEGRFAIPSVVESQAPVATPCASTTHSANAAGVSGSLPATMLGGR